MGTTRADSAPPRLTTHADDPLTLLRGESPRSDPGLTTPNIISSDEIMEEHLEGRSRFQQADQDLERVIRGYANTIPDSCCLCGVPLEPQGMVRIVKVVDVGGGREGVYLSDRSYLNRKDGTIPMRACLACRYRLEATMTELGPLGLSTYREHKRKLAARKNSSRRAILGTER